MSDLVNRPPHYYAGGLEAIDVIDAFFADKYHRGQVFKYIARAGKKDDELQDLQKARFYLDRDIARLQAEQDAEDNATVTQITRQLLREGRVWETIRAIPYGVVVVDHEGDEWVKGFDGKLYVRFDGDFEFRDADAAFDDDDDFNPNDCGPFLEVIE